MTRRQPKTPAAWVAGEPGTPPPDPPRAGVEGEPGNTSSPPQPQGNNRGGEEGREAWRKALADLHKAQRNRRGHRPAPQITGVRVAQRPRGKGQ